MIISDIGNPFFTTLVRGIEDVAQEAGFSVVLCNGDEDPEKETRYVTAALAQRMAGVIISPSGRPALINQLTEAGMPVVAIDRQPRGVSVDAVLVDNIHGAEAATAHLIGGGYHRIACITGPRRISTAVQRLRGYQQAIRAAGRSVTADLVRYADYRQEGGYRAMASLLSAPEPPDAVFVANNLMTVGAMECLVDRGVVVPTRCGMVGFDDIPWADLVRPSLSTVAQPTYDLGRTAASLLTERIADPARARPPPSPCGRPCGSVRARSGPSPSPARTRTLTGLHRPAEPAPEDTGSTDRRASRSSPTGPTWSPRSTSPVSGSSRRPIWTWR